MSDAPPLAVLLYWHQHQPLYKDPVANAYELPWVRLHATKDYVDMVTLLEEFPGIKSNFNLVPSLLVQLDDYAEGKANDKFLNLSAKPARDLTPEDQQFILHNFFMANWEHMVDRYPRYRELLDKRGRRLTPESLPRARQYFKEQDWRDLQVWFNLTWFDPLWQEKDSWLASLHAKGKHFTEEEKLQLLAKQKDLCGQVVVKHRELQERGQIELTTTPFYHPILPLLCDTEVARAAMPHINLPKLRFRHPEDARRQVVKALEDYQRRFGRAPRGMWPAEGSVSPEAVQIIAEAGIEWVATDEAVLANSIGPDFDRDDLYEPFQYKMGDKTLRFFFRDHELSDAIGFVYASWDPEQAAQNFIDRLHGIAARLRQRDGSRPRQHVVPVILDGENCWEYYKDDGLPFLRALYRRLEADATLATVRASDYLSSLTDIKPLPRLWSGSWINSNFAIWIGHGEDNRAWDLLGRTRDFLEKVAAKPTKPEEKVLQQAWEEIYIAEGSDWCWWYGEDHSSANDEMFDHLFRKHLMNVYTLVGEKVPEDLYLPIKRRRVAPVIAPPSDFISPVLDGRETSYFEWRYAGVYQTEAGATGTMHKSENFIKTIYFGFDLTQLYFRIDTNRPLSTEPLPNLAIKLSFYQPEGYDALLHFQADGTAKLELRTSNGSEPTTQTLTPGQFGKIIEFAVPLKVLPIPANQNLELFIILLKDNLEQERWPVDSMLQIPYPHPEVFAENWVV